MTFGIQKKKLYACYLDQQTVTGTTRQILHTDLFYLHASTSPFYHLGHRGDRGLDLSHGELLPDTMAHYLTMTIAICLTFHQGVHALVVLEQLRPPHAKKH